MSAFRWAAASVLLAALWCAPLAGSGADTPDQRFQSALAHYNSGDYTAAQQELETLVRELPKSFEVQELLGLVYSAEGREELATPRLTEAVRLKPDSGAARNNLATNLARLGKTALAGAEFRKVVEMEPGSYDANHNLGEFYVTHGDIAAAVPYLEKAQRANPAAYDNGYNLALAYEKTGRLSQAEEQIRRLLTQKDTAELHNLLAEVEEKSGNFVAAANDYEAAAHMEPSEANLFDWGGELLMHQTWTPAIEVFSAGLKRYPRSSRLAVGLGLAYYLKGSYDDAVKALIKATELNPSDSHAYYFLSKAYDQSPNQADEVIECFRQFSELRPNDAQAEYDYAMSLWKGKRGDTAAAYLDRIELLLKKSIALDPSSGDAHLQLGNLYSQRKEFDKAVPEYQQALKLEPNQPDAHFRLGQAYVHLGKRDQAEKEFQVHQKLYEQHLAEIDKQRMEIKQFVYSQKAASTDP
jgi:tetratricopeptide (TPR) repeat protein